MKEQPISERDRRRPRALHVFQIVIYGYLLVMFLIQLRMYWVREGRRSREYVGKSGAPRRKKGVRSRPRRSKAYDDHQEQSRQAQRRADRWSLYGTSDGHPGARPGQLPLSSSAGWRCRSRLSEPVSPFAR